MPETFKGVEVLGGPRGSALINAGVRKDYLESSC